MLISKPVQSMLMSVPLSFYPKPGNPYPLLPDNPYPSPSLPPLQHPYPYPLPHPFLLPLSLPQLSTLHPLLLLSNNPRKFFTMSIKTWTLDIL